MKPEKLSAAPQERYSHSLCHPVGILFLVDIISIIMTSLRDFFGHGVCFLGCGLDLVTAEISSEGAICS